MGWIRMAIVVLLLPLGEADAAGVSALEGTWGNARACHRDLIVPDGTVRASPFVIAKGWLRHGSVWCGLTWEAVQDRSNGFFATARARCGEDSQRGYRLDFALRQDGGTAEMTLIWDETLLNGPLRRCSGT